jgi:DNA polymerase-4
VVRSILHVDMDAFYAAVEQLDEPSLRGKPVLVGGLGRSVVLAASYEARPSGARSAMPMVEARRRCPEAIVVPPRHARYAEISRRVFEVFRRYTPLVEGLSVDEAFLDVTGSRSLFGDGATIAARIKADIRAEIGLTASAGVAPVKFVAKIASDLRKPDGLVVVGPDEVEAFLAPLPVERMWGVGPKTAARVRAAGLATIGDLARAEEAVLGRLLGSWGSHVGDLARGVDPREVVVGGEAKSIGSEETFERDLRTAAEIEPQLLAQAGRVAGRLVAEALSARVVTVKVKYADFKIKTRQKRLDASADDTDSIYEAARELLARFPGLTRGVRLTGVSVSGLVPGPPERTLFPEARREKRHKLEQTVAALRDRFGPAGVTRATLLGKEREED